MRIRVMAVLSIASASLSLTAGSFAQAPGPYFYYYLGEPIPLGETADALAAFDQANGSVDPLLALLGDAAIPEPQVERHPIGNGWFTVRFNAASEDAPPDIPSTIDTLIEHDVSGRYFFSPVFTGPGGAPVIAPPEILILFEEEVATADVENILKAGGVDAGTSALTRATRTSVRVPDAISPSKTAVGARSTNATTMGRRWQGSSVERRSTTSGRSAWRQRRRSCPHGRSLVM